MVITDISNIKPCGRTDCGPGEWYWVRVGDALERGEGNNLEDIGWSSGGSSCGIYIGGNGEKYHLGGSNTFRLNYWIPICVDCLKRAGFIW